MAWVVAGNYLKSLKPWKNQWKKRLNQDRLAEIGQFGEGLMRKVYSGPHI
jgi:hypothetical protein